MSRSDFEKNDWFPNFIILCKPVSEASNSEESGNMENEWNGVLREMEKVIKSQIEASKQHQKKVTNSMIERIEQLSNEGKKSSEDINKRMDEMNKRMEGMNSRIDGVNNKIENRMHDVNNQIEKRMDDVNQRMDEIKEMLKNILNKNQIA